MKIPVILAILAASAAWADEAADRAAIEATISALNTSPTRPDLFTADFPNAADLRRLLDPPTAARVPSEGTVIQTSAGTVVISHEPMGEATWIPPASQTAGVNRPRFVTRSVTFVDSETAVVVAAYQKQSVLLVLKNVVENEATNWRIASFRVLPEAQTKVLL